MKCIQERIRGSLLGLAWGDALGCPVEGWMKPEIARIYGLYSALPEAYPLNEIRAMDATRLKKLRPLGLHSDDTQQALALIQICVTQNGWACERWATALVEGLKRNAWRGFGRNFSSAIHKLKKGSSPQVAGSSSAGIGSAMRIAPLGALYRDNPGELSRVVMESSLITHGDIRAGSLAYAVAWTVAEFCIGADAQSISSRLPGAIETVELEWLNSHEEWSIDRSAGTLVSRVLGELLAESPRDYSERCALLSKLARPYLADGFTKAHPNQGFVLLGGAHALLEALFCTGAPEETLIRIIQQGYDTDTVAAICGGILGSRFGTDWIPQKRLLDRDVLNSYADAMVSRNAIEDLDALLKREADWTLCEKEFQRKLVSK